MNEVDHFSFDDFFIALAIFLLNYGFFFHLLKFYLVGTLGL